MVKNALENIYQTQKSSGYIVEEPDEEDDAGNFGKTGDPSQFHSYKNNLNSIDETPIDNRLEYDNVYPYLEDKNKEVFTDENPVFKDNSAETSD
jgi:hypothetical protein